MPVASGVHCSSGHLAQLFGRVSDAASEWFPTRGEDQRGLNRPLFACGTLDWAAAEIAASSSQSWLEEHTVVEDVVDQQQSTLQV